MSLALSMASYIVSNPMFVSCFLIISIQVICGLPRGLFSGFSASYRACLAGQFSGILAKCTNQLILCFITFSEQFLAFVFSYNCSFVTLSDHLIPRVLRSNILWNMSIYRSCFFVSVHTSQLYRNMLSIRALFIFSFVSNDIYLLLYTFFTEAYALFAKAFLRLISFFRV